ncbi:MAG: hypothetical protein ACR2L3_02060, partial [Actinomycetota bacterium]
SLAALATLDKKCAPSQLGEAPRQVKSEGRYPSTAGNTREDKHAPCLGESRGRRQPCERGRIVRIEPRRAVRGSDIWAPDDPTKFWGGLRLRRMLK